MSTKDRILAAAEELFAEAGIAATSLRQITGRAGVNLAAVNYHFGSRDALIEAVFERRLKPLNEERLARLDQLKTGSTPTLGQIVKAFIEPVLSLSRDPERGGPRFVRLVAQSYTETSSRFERFFTGQYREVLERFADVLEESLPELQRDEIHWRLHFMIGATAYTIVDSHLLRLIAGSEQTGDMERTLAYLEPFLIAGFQAPAAPQN